ncbi:2OG-Fe(II) oxygenase [Fortiea sp. LEGE XX443]
MLLQKVQKKFFKKIYQIPFIRHKTDIAYQIAVDKYKPNLPIISKDDLELVDRINNEGVVVTSLDNLGILSNTQLLKAAKNIASQMKPNIDSDQNKFVVHASQQQIMEHPEIFLWGLEERLLNIVEHYFCLPVAYHGAYFRRDIANQLETGSRLWHIDQEDRKVLKIIVYVNDVTDNQGPFQYIPLSLTSSIAQSLKYTYGYIRNQTMQKVISPSNYKSCIGNSGTVVFAGTGGIFHRGKPPENSDRFTIFFDYTSRRKKELFYINPSLSQKDLIILSKHLSERQKKCLFWQKYLE